MRWVRWGLIVSSIGAALLVLEMALALGGSRLAPSWDQSFVPLVGIILGAAMLVGGLLPMQREIARRVVWRVDPEVPAEAGAEVRRRKTMRAPMPIWPMASLLFLLGGAYLTVLYPQAHEWGALRARGVETTGTVTAIERHRIEYTYAVAGETQKGHERMTARETRGLRQGGTVPVTYVPEAPAVSSARPRSAFNWRTGFVKGIGSDVVRPLFPMLVILMLLPAMAQKGRERIENLYRNGETAIGTVTRVSGSAVYYTFTIPDGRFEGRFLYRNNAAARPAEGDRFVVLYDPAKPKTNLPWVVAAASFA